MLTYLIDGNNLYYSVPEICDSKNPRRALVDFIRLNRLAGSPRNEVIIVFDGHDSSELFGESEYKIVYANDRSADDVIKEIISKTKNKKNTVLVSDDRSIAMAARGEGARVQKTGEFTKAAKKKKAPKNYDRNYEQDEERRKKITDELKKLWLKE